MLAAIALLVAAYAPAEPAGIPRTTPAAAAAGAAACRGLPEDYDEAVRRLLEDGWERATISGPPQPDAAPLPIFGRDRVIMVVPPPEADEPRFGTGCMVTAAFERDVRWPEVVAAAEAAFGTAASISSDSSAEWRLDGGRYLVMLARRSEHGILGATFIVVPVRPAAD